MQMVVALGGNAILRRGERGTAEEQRYHVKIAAGHLVRIIQGGHQIIITHGNGPQIGDILEKDECASDKFPRMPLDICGAESLGMIGYLIQQALENALSEAGMNNRVITVVSQTLVDQEDPAFRSPEKPIGPFYAGPESAMLESSLGWMMHEIPGQGFRRVVPSPIPLEIVETNSIRTLFEEGFIVVASGGGGIPVIRDKEGRLSGVEA
ncbi:MAG: carbamate kinase, partial [Methanoregulaceae archaeon]|nr:carbamate kinase [Methanoregulaceae archaeon]